MPLQNEQEGAIYYLYDYCSPSRYIQFHGTCKCFVMGALGLSLLVIVLGDEMATLYLMMALIPFYNSLNIGGIATDFIVQGAALIKLFMSRSRGIKPSLLMSFFIALFLLIIPISS